MDPTDLPDLVAVRRLLSTERGLCVLSVSRPDGTISSSLVNAGLMDHPDGSGPVLAVVAKATAYKVRRLRVAPMANIAVTRGWQWQAVEGPVTLVGPHDPHPAVGAAGLPGLLRAVFAAAGGTHDDWDEFDRVMAREERTALLLAPGRAYGITGV
jgi:hypothetical protein